MDSSPAAGASFLHADTASSVDALRTDITFMAPTTEGTQTLDVPAQAIRVCEQFRAMDAGHDVHATHMDGRRVSMMVPQSPTDRFLTAAFWYAFDALCAVATVWYAAAGDGWGTALSAAATIMLTAFILLFHAVERRDTRRPAIPYTPGAGYLDHDGVVLVPATYRFRMDDDGDQIHCYLTRSAPRPHSGAAEEQERVLWSLPSETPAAYLAVLAEDTREYVDRTLTQPAVDDVRAYIDHAREEVERTAALGDMHADARTANRALMASLQDQMNAPASRGTGE